MRWFTHFSIAATASAAVFFLLAALTPARSLQIAPVGTDKIGETIGTGDETRVGTPQEKATRIFADGIVEGASRELSLRFEVAGRIKAIHAREGATVKAGDVLAELDSELADVQLAEAQTRLKIATAERDRTLAAAPSTLSAEDKTIAEGVVELARAAVRRELLLLHKLHLHAPIDGLVLRVVAEPGEFTGPTDELVVLVDRAATRVRAFVEELDGLGVVPEQRAAVSVTGNPGKSYRGTVRTCAPCFCPKTQRRLKPGERLDIRMREVVIDLEDGRDLLIGMPVEVFIEPARSHRLSDSRVHN
ncbi:MAG TPA: efflux RND transporter periplasmic adaptor subunit [Pirellulales bacterium]|jgi:multidrug efflux pump subunit AcrA (membrane-fusion protein)|nr:efflux RND transporter periplasmic adaptor subunit [Pirellulales bacterium]